eukprot:187715-Amphidinium_carterae.1
MTIAIKYLRLLIQAGRKTHHMMSCTFGSTLRPQAILDLAHEQLSHCALKLRRDCLRFVGHMELWQSYLLLCQLVDSMLLVIKSDAPVEATGS